MIICPNFSNPDVAREFNELKEATTEKAAYAIWSRNNGNAIDKAPNGALSKLFQNLLNYFKGDRNAAIKAKAKIYSNEFIKWFGNWTGQEGLFPEYEEKEVENVSKAVDENGEPLMLWHGTDYVFDEFKYDENNERGSHKVHDVHSFFFTDSQEKAFKYRHNITMPVFLNMKNPGESSVKDGKYRTLNEYTNRENELIRDDRYDSVLIERYDKEGDHHGMVPTKQWVVKKPNQIKSATDNNGQFSTENNNIQKTVLSESEYKNMIDEINLDQDKTDLFLYNFVTKVLQVNPKRKTDVQSESFNFDIIKGRAKVNFERFDNLAKKIFGFSVGIDMSSKESIEKSIDDLLSNWEDLLILQINNPTNIDRYYRDRNTTRDSIKLLLRYLDHGLNIESFDEDEQSKIKQLITKYDGSPINTKQKLGYQILKLKNELNIQELTLIRAIYARNSTLLAAKNRLVALNVIDDLKQIVKQRLLSEYESYLPNELEKRDASRFSNLVKSINEVLDSKNTNKQLDAVFTSDVEHQISYDDFINTILKSYPEYSDLIRIFKNANPELKIIIGILPKDELVGIVPGWFSPRENTLCISNKCDIYTCIHELAHSATYYGMTGSTEDTEAFSSQIQKFMDYIQDYIRQNKLNPALFLPYNIMGVQMPAHIYGFTNPSEFIAEVFGNPKFLNLLLLIPAMENKEFKSLFHLIWDMLIDFLNNLLGINKIQKNALDQAKVLGLTCCLLLLNNINDIYNQLNDILNRDQNQYTFDPYYESLFSKIEFLKNKVQKNIKYTDFKLKFIKGEDRYCILLARGYVKSYYTFDELKNFAERVIEEAGGSAKDFNIYPSKKAGDQSIVITAKFSNNLQKTVLNNPNNQLLLNQSITRQIYDLGILIDTERQLYITSILNQYKINNPNATSNDLSRVMNNARKQFNIDKSNDLIRQKLIALALAFGLNMNADGFYESQETTQKKLMLEHFINSLLKSTFDAYNLENINRTKYQLVGSVLNATSIGNVIYTALWDSDLATLDKELARDYVRMFWGSDLIQSALDALKTQNLTSQELEDALVDRMTTEPVSSRDTSIIDWFRNIWNQLQQLVKTVFGSHTFTDQQKVEILKAVDAAYMISEDLEYTNVNNVIYDRADGNYNSSIMLSEKDKEVLSNIKSGIKTRLKSQLARNTKNQKLIADLRTALEIIDSKNEDSIDDVFNIIQEFLINANREIGVTRYYIDNTLLLKNSMDNWDPQLINFIQQDLIGYYKNLLSTVANLFSDRKSSINKFNTHRVLSDPNAIDLKNVSKQLVNDIDGLLNDYNHRVVKPYVRKILIDYVNQEDAISDKGLFIYNMEKWLEQDQAYGDLAAGEVIIGMASRSKSPIVRIVEKMMSEAEYTTSRQVLKKGHDLIKLYNKIRPVGSQISPYNWQKRFMEFDDTNTSTGYFVREINYGQFYKDKDAKENELRIKYGLFVDENGDTIFPDEDSTKDDSVYNKYYDELDEWLDKRCERRYKLEYYKAKRRRLSPATIKALNQLQRQIDLLLDKCRMTNGFVDLSKLSVNERRLLEVLRKQKRDLGSHYIFTEENGILKVEPKTGESLKMADEITAWNDYLKNKVNYKPDWTSFNQAKQLLINNGATQQEILNFERNNTTMRLTSEFYDILHSISKHNFVSKELDDLKHRHREIINAIKARPGAGSHNLNRLGTGLNTDQSGWAELQRIEQRMAEIKRQLLKTLPGMAVLSSLKFEDIAKMIYVTVDDTNKQSYLEYLINQWRNASYTNTNLTNVFNQLFTYVDEKGKRRYLNAFKYLSPINWTINVNGKVIKCIDTVPGSEYSELDESSLLVNENFVKDGKSMLPKAFDNNGERLYKNESYEKLTSDEKTFLLALLDTMDEANSMIPNKALYRDELLPLISGRTMSVLSNTLRNMEWQTALKYSVRKFGVKYAETTEDVSTNVDLARRPDGTVVNNIPIRFVNKLDNPAVQTTDVLGSVIMFYDMACNYKNKSQNLPVLELIKYSISPDSRTLNRMPEQYAKVENLLDLRYYGKETSFGFNTNEKITDAKQRVIQGTKTIRNFASVAMLGVNFTTIEVGYIDAMCSMLADAIGDKYLTTLNMRRAFVHCIKHTPNMLRGLGKQVVNDKLVAAMLYNQLSRSNSEIFSATDKFKLDRFVHDHLLMGGYTLTDYMVNSMMVYATYDHYRLILDPKTNKNKFYSKTDAINEFTKLGYTESEAVDLWENAKTTLWEAYDCINGDFVLKDTYKDIVTKKLEDRIVGRLRDRTAMYNGIIPMTEKAKIQLNVFGSFITLMRNFYINTYWDRFKTGGDYVTEDGDHNINWYSEYKRDDLGMVNLETGEFEGAVFKDFIRGMCRLTANTKHVLKHEDLNKLTREQKYAVRRCTTELILISAMLFAMLWSVAFARKNDYDDDKKPAWTLNLTGDNTGLHINTKNMDDKFYDWFRWKMALLATRGFTERLTSWWLPTAIEPLTSPTVATSYLDDIGTMWHLADDLFSQRADEEIKSGGYKHMTRGTRDILKIMSPLGIDNLVRQWHTEGIKSTFRYYRSMAPTSAIVPTLEEYNIAHGKGKNGGNKNSKNKKNKNQIRME